MWRSLTRPKQRGRCTSGRTRAALPHAAPTHSPARTLACALHRAPSDLQGHIVRDDSGCRGADYCSQGNWWHVFCPRRPRCNVDARASPLAIRQGRRGAGGARARDADAARVGLLARLAHCQAAGRACREDAPPRARLLQCPLHI
eukprot:scaffold13922_cov87-Phaeocystis_antarctica.AAC.1